MKLSDAIFLGFLSFSLVMILGFIYGAATTDINLMIDTAQILAVTTLLIVPIKAIINYVHHLDNRNTYSYRRVNK